MKKFLITMLMLLFTVPALAENTILILGDSLSAGYGIDPAVGWASLLAKRLKAGKYDYRVVNASISGDTSSNGLSRLPTALTAAHPEITIIELGGNDGLRGLAPDQIKKNLTSLIALAKQAGSKVLVVGVRIPPNYGLAYTQQFEGVYQDLAKMGGVTVVPLFLKGIDDHAGWIQADGIHPTQDAQTKMLDNVWVGLKALLQ
jgi:acyl-CoA thioesterase-1